MDELDIKWLPIPNDSLDTSEVQSNWDNDEFWEEPMYYFDPDLDIDESWENNDEFWDDFE